MQTAAWALPVPFVSNNQSQAAETDTSVAALIAPEQDVNVVLQESAGLSKLGVNVVGESFQNPFELMVASDPLQVQRKIAQVMVSVQFVRNCCLGYPLSFPFAFFFAFLFFYLRVVKTVSGVHDEKMLVGRNARAVSCQHILQQSGNQIRFQVEGAFSAQQSNCFSQQRVVVFRTQKT